MNQEIHTIEKRKNFCHRIETTKYSRIEQKISASMRWCLYVQFEC